MEKETVAYKGYNNLLQGHGGFQYTIGQTYCIDNDPVVCAHGFHACLNILDCLSYYDISTSRFAKVTIFGAYDSMEDKICAKKFVLMRN